MDKTLYAKKKVRVSYGAPNNNYDGNELRVGVQSSTSTRYMSLVQFDLSPIPFSKINSATLKLYSYSDQCWQAQSKILVRRITNDWDPGDITYNGIKNYVTSSNQGSGTNSGYNVWYTYDVKNIVQDWINGVANHGFYMIQDGLATQKGKAFHNGSQYNPQLIIDYTPMGMQANVNGEWKDCLIKVNQNGHWKLCRAHANKNGSWEKCK